MGLLVFKFGFDNLLVLLELFAVDRGEILEEIQRHYGTSAHNLEIVFNLLDRVQILLQLPDKVLCESWKKTAFNCDARFIRLREHSLPPRSVISSPPVMWVQPLKRCAV